MSRAGVYLIIEDSPLVAADIAEAIRVLVPDARVVELRTDVAMAGEDAVATSTQTVALATAFISMRVADLVHSGLGTAIVARGGRVVVLADDSEEAADAAMHGWSAVLRPFMAEDLTPFIAPAPASTGGF